ncbi:hypothetical protein [Lacticaseibacillus rhamnosus]|nr:hypothetical protein [Lacticaseibacillus rhamnosus]
MNAILISVVGIIAVAILIYMLLKKNDIKMTLLGSPVYNSSATP